MGVDYYNCDGCKEIIPDCGDYERCDTCSAFFCTDCGNNPDIKWKWGENDMCIECTKLPSRINISKSKLLVWICEKYKLDYFKEKQEYIMKISEPEICTNCKKSCDSLWEEVGTGLCCGCDDRKEKCEECDNNTDKKI